MRATTSVLVVLSQPRQKQHLTILDHRATDETHPRTHHSVLGERLTSSLHLLASPLHFVWELIWTQSESTHGMVVSRRPHIVQMAMKICSPRGEVCPLLRSCSSIRLSSRHTEVKSGLACQMRSVPVKMEGVDRFQKGIRFVRFEKRVVANCEFPTTGQLVQTHSACLRPRGHLVLFGFGGWREREQSATKPCQGSRAVPRKSGIGVELQWRSSTNFSSMGELLNSREVVADFVSKRSSTKDSTK